MYKEKDHRVHRILSIYERLVKGKVLNKEQLAFEFGVNNKSIQRDIEQIIFHLYLWRKGREPPKSPIERG